MKKYLKMYLIIPNTLRKYLNTNTNTFVFCTSNTNTNTNTKKKVFKYDQIQIQKYLTPCLLPGAMTCNRHRPTIAKNNNAKNKFYKILVLCYIFKSSAQKVHFYRVTY